MRQVSLGLGAGQFTRRLAIRQLLLNSCFTALVSQAQAQDGQRVMDTWMEHWMQSKGLFGRLHMSRFVEPIYFLTQPTTWRPNRPTTSFAEVTVPTGFVTDFASIPQLFWSLLRPDGEYAHAAVVHDYLYWTQTRNREEADSIFKIAMQDLDVNPVVVNTLYQAVQMFGASAWAENTQRKRSGERRVLKRIPLEVGARWRDWRKIADAFSEE